MGEKSWIFTGGAGGGSWRRSDRENKKNFMCFLWKRKKRRELTGRKSKHVRGLVTRQIFSRPGRRKPCALAPNRGQALVVLLAPPRRDYQVCSLTRYQAPDCDSRASISNITPSFPHNSIASYPGTRGCGAMRCCHGTCKPVLVIGCCGARLRVV